MKIPSYGNQAQSTAAPNVQHAYLQDTRAQSLGNALQNAGDVVTKIQIEERNKADRAALMDADTQTSQLANTIYNQNASKVLKDAIGIAPTALKEFDEQSEKINATLKTDRQRRAYAEARNQARTTFQRQIETHERGQTEAYYNKSRQDYQGQQHVNAVTAYTDQKVIDQSLVNLQASVMQTPGLDNDMKALDYSEKSSKLYADVVGRYLANDQVIGAEKYYTAIKDKVNGDVASQIESGIRVAKNRLKAQTESNLAEERQSYRDELSDIEAAFRSRIPVTSLPSEARAIALFGEERGKRMHQTAKMMQQASIAVANLDTIPTDKLVETALSYKPASQKDAAITSELYGVVSQSVSSVIAERQRDPVGYLQAKSPAVTQAYERFNTNPSDASRAEYLTALEGARAQLAISGQDILSKGEEQSVVARMTQQTDSRSMVDSLRAEQERWGADFPRVFQQVGKDLPDTAYLIPNVPEKAANILAAASRLTDEEAKKTIAGGKTHNDVVADVYSRLSDLRESFPIEGVSAYEKIESGTVKLAMGYMANGMSYGTAIKQAVADTTGQHEFHTYKDHTFRVPIYDAGRPLDTNAVVSGAAQALRAFKAPDRLVPDSIHGKDVESERLTEDIKRNGYWVTAPDESGLWLFNRYQPVGFPPISYTWQELQQLAADYRLEAQREQEIRRNLDFVPSGGE